MDEYRRIVGQLIYCMIGTRTDIGETHLGVPDVQGDICGAENVDDLREALNSGTLASKVFVE